VDFFEQGILAMLLSLKKVDDIGLLKVKTWNQTICNVRIVREY